MLSPHSADSGQALAVPVRVLDGTEAEIAYRRTAADWQKQQRRREGADATTGRAI
jgi:hypothetical protein